MKLVEPETGGDPMSAAKYIRRSLRQLSTDLTRCGHAACATTIGRLLRERAYALRVNCKRFTGPAHAERDAQFRYIRDWLDLCHEHGVPVVSVDTKKKELIGNFANAGATWSRSADEVNAHDFPQDAVCRAAPYGIYDLGSNRGHVVVGTSADTPQFAVDAIAGWWGREGERRYADASMLLVLADAGGSNGCRPRLWKLALQERLADRYGLAVTVCHYPTGASKWNPVEHRLFGPISINWAGKPLRSLQFMLACLRGTKTNTGLRVTARPWCRHYAKGIKVTDQQWKALDIERHPLCPQWNYTIWPRQPELLN
jgi:hypothetical protein